MPTYEQDVTRLRGKFVNELLALKKVPLDFYNSRLTEIKAQLPLLTWFSGHTFDRSIKVQTSVDADINVKPIYPTLTYNGVVRSYAHPDGSFRSLPSVGEFIYQGNNATELSDLADFATLKHAILYGFTPDKIPNDNPDFINSLYYYYQATHIGYVQNPPWNPPNTGFYQRGVTLRDVRTITPQSFISVDRFFTFGGTANYIETMISPSRIKHRAKSVGGTYDASEPEVNGAIIRISTEKEVRVFIFNKIFLLTPPANNVQIKWIIVTTEDGGVNFAELLTQDVPV